ncbi:MAG: aromatic acid exporter family protein, partial [SAR324 cluster bacterium]|nr:aromatic acid exporter family protein [SAR324 cluster bacterium]
MAPRSLPQWINAPLKIAVAAVVALFLARILHLPEAFWAPISAIVCSLDDV